MKRISIEPRADSIESALRERGQVPFIPVNNSYRKVFSGMPEEITLEHFGKNVDDHSTMAMRDKKSPLVSI